PGWILFGKNVLFSGNGNEDAKRERGGGRERGAVSSGAGFPLNRLRHAAFEARVRGRRHGRVLPEKGCQFVFWHVAHKRTPSFLSSASLSLRAACRRDFTVPVGISRVSPISSMENPSTALSSSMALLSGFRRLNRIFTISDA